MPWNLLSVVNAVSKLYEMLVGCVDPIDMCIGLTTFESGMNKCELDLSSIDESLLPELRSHYQCCRFSRNIA